MPPVIPNPTYKLTPEQQYEFDVKGYIVLRDHYDADIVAQLHETASTNCKPFQSTTIPTESSV